MHILTRFQSRVSVVYITLTGNSKILSLLSPPRRSDLASLATEERHSPNPVFDPPRGETHRHRGAETRRFHPNKRVRVPIERFPVSTQTPTQSKKIPSCLSHRRRPSFFFLHAKISVASSSSHQTAEMGAVTLHSGLGNPTLRQRHNARRRVGDHFERSGNTAIFGNSSTPMLHLPGKTLLLIQHLCLFKELKSKRTRV